MSGEMVLREQLRLMTKERDELKRQLENSQLSGAAAQLSVAHEIRLATEKAREVVEELRGMAGENADARRASHDVSYLIGAAPAPSHRPPSLSTVQHAYLQGARDMQAGILEALQGAGQDTALEIVKARTIITSHHITDHPFLNQAGNGLCVMEVGPGRYCYRTRGEHER